MFKHIYMYKMPNNLRIWHSEFSSHGFIKNIYMQLAITNMYIPPTFMFDMLVFIWSHILENLVFADPVIEIKI